VECHLGDTGDHERIQETAQHREHDDPQYRRTELADEHSHHFTPKALMMMSMSLIPMKGMMMPPMP
jgi:hypothetical protein